MERTEEMFLKNAIFFQYFTVVEQFLLQFVKINKVNVKNALASLLQIPPSKVKFCIAFTLFNRKFLSNLCINTSK